MLLARALLRKPGLVPGFFCAGFVAACGGPPEGDTAQRGMAATLEVAGHMSDATLDEISGMARSGRDPGLLWVHNDSGDKARLHAIGLDGEYRARLKIEDADNVDWEDLASFSLEGTPYLLVADIGNNEGTREILTLYVIEEPDLSDDDRLAAAAAWRIHFRYPDGPRDAEAVAVDAADDSVWILSKRDLPPVLYRLPLRPAGPDPVVAMRVAEFATLPVPSRREVEFAPVSRDWYWQPTALDIAPDGSFVAVLTYGAVYYFPRPPGTGVDESLAGPPLRFSLRNLRNAEALAVGADARRLFVTVEAQAAPLLRIDFGPPPTD